MYTGTDSTAQAHSNLSSSRGEIQYSCANGMFFSCCNTLLSIWWYSGLSLLRGFTVFISTNSNFNVLFTQSQSSMNKILHVTVHICKSIYYLNFTSCIVPVNILLMLYLYRTSHKIILPELLTKCLHYKVLDPPNLLECSCPHPDTNKAYK